MITGRDIIFMAIVMGTSIFLFSQKYFAASIITTALSVFLVPYINSKSPEQERDATLGVRKQDEIRSAVPISIRTKSCSLPETPKDKKKVGKC